jgi:hypothetical protein
LDFFILSKRFEFQKALFSITGEDIMRNFNEWELRELQLELQQLDEDFVELNNFFASEAFIFSNKFSGERAVDMVSENTYSADSDRSTGSLSSIDAVEERNDEQMLIEKFIID